MGEGTVPAPPGRGRISRATWGSVLLTCVAAAWFAANFDHPRGPVVLLWLAAPLSVVIPAGTCWRAYRAGWLPVPTRRFWRHLGTAAVLVGIGSVAATHDALSGVAGPAHHLGPVALVAYAGAMVVILWGLYRLPTGVSGRGERLRLGLDAATVVLATAVFLWHFQTRTLLAQGADDPSSVVGSWIEIVLALVSVFAVAKVVLSGDAFVDKRSLQWLAVGLIGGSLGSLPQSLLVDRPWLICSQVTIPAVMICATVASVRQRRARTVDDGRRPAHRRFSVLPYAAVVAVDALLLSATWSGRGDDQRVIVVGAVVLTALVAVRQVTAFQENGRLLARLDHGATHDALTQLPNRALFGDRLRRAVTTCDAHRKVSVALIDLDDFKAVNDTLGHRAGDALLVAVAQRLAGCVRARDTVGRLGGDEFIVVLDDIDPAGADLAVQRILAALTTPVVADGHELLVRASIGVADGGTGDDADELLRRADIAMYAAKNDGGGGFARYRPDLGGAGRPAPLGAELRQAIADGQFFLVYQPIVALDGQHITGVEALVRWAHPARGTVPPDEFIPVAERTGLIVPLGQWVLREACRQFVRWSVLHGARAPEVLNVNVSGRQLREPQFPDDVAAALADTGIAAHRLVLEITETAAVGPGTAVANLAALRQLGVRIALDDFGTGVSALSLLQTCPVDELKLDRSFTQTDPATEHTPIAAAVIHLAQALGLHVVAEGVETAQQAQRLRTLGYRAAQGYYFARPMPPADLDDLLAGGTRTDEPVRAPA